MQAVQETLQLVMDERKWSLKKVAEEIGISEGSLREWKDGKVQGFRFEYVANLFKLANKSLDAFVGIPSARAPIQDPTIQLIIDVLTEHSEQLRGLDTRLRPLELDKVKRYYEQHPEEPQPAVRSGRPSARGAEKGLTGTAKESLDNLRKMKDGS